MSTTTPSSSPRDRGLDLLRGLALVRVVLWHATGAAVLTLVAAMPVMFFVSGELFGRSAGRRGAWRTVVDRVRRIGPPLWAFAAVAWTVMAVGAELSGTGLRPWRAVWWILPLTDPQGSSWEGGWLATPLWYLRTLLWVLLLSPLLVRAVRRAPGVTVAVGAALVVALEAADRVGRWSPSWAPGLLWQVGDVVLYGTFFALGLAAARRAAIPRRWALGGAAAAVTASAVWWVVAPPPGGVVNDSHITHLLAGTAVLGLAMAARPALARVAEWRPVRPAVHLLGQRSLTIYLWHTTAVVVALWALNRSATDAPLLRWGTYAALVVAGTAVLVAATGWLEDLAARRAPVLWPSLRDGTAATGADLGRRARWRPGLVPAVAFAVVVVLVPVAATGPTTGVDTFALRVPSQAPPPPVVDDAVVVAHGTRPLRLDPDGLDRLLARWADDADVDGAVLAVSTPEGGTWSGAVGRGPDGDRSVEEAIDIASVTKLFTANLVYRVVDAGLIGLDDPLPPLEGVPDELAGRVTVRQLLSHRSGLANYRETEPYLADPTVVADPASAVAVSMPGEGEELGVGEPRYSSTNYLLLGRLLEHLTGASFGELLRFGLLEPNGLWRTSHLPPAPGEPRFATAGIVTDIADLARAGTALLVDHVGISDEAWRAMSSVDPERGLGAGTQQFCPCTLDGDGEPRAFAVGYASGHTLLVLLPDHEVVVALDLTEPFFGDAGRFDDVQSVLHQVVDVLDGDDTDEPIGGEPAPEGNEAV